MIQPFDFYNPTHIVFGPERLNELDSLIPQEARVLILFGGESARRFGTIDKVREGLGKRTVLEFAGVEANPTYETLMKAVAVVKDEKIDFLLAVGGGSVIDGTKFVAAAAEFDGDPIDMFGGGIGKQLPIHSALPFGSVLTLPATASEMNAGSVITFVEKGAKLGFGSAHTFPKFSFLDPTLTYTLPKRQLANGIVDAFVHIFEQYMTYDAGALVTDRFSEGLLQTLIEIGPRVVNDSEPDYNDRANFMWAATNALNGVLRPGVPQDWATHMIGHEITNLFHIDHARTLAAILPAMLTVRKTQKQSKLLQYGERVWGITTGTDDERITAAIDKTAAFLESLEVPTSLSAYDLTAKDVDALVANLIAHDQVKLSEHGDLTPEISREILLASL
ncbi:MULTISPECIES: iron-containing alcohol dehydrogenase [Brochothrix]|uniref:NADH-dependent alcohol dehydrogenase n=1 Tax=Brochothrix thermosphacta TaxID=2756 RepID=A0A1D2LK50_BROTH|nr:MULTISPECIES: iron-containing alcohol dehydrogenase [Brochothrix]SLM96565.1 NADH-dependent butanol dehydrogenase A [Brachybacterium faecium]ATF24956.1 NADH-dependent alcohol dehydrogenase [Brochothrix thermosphacta]ATH84372.1 NADH-dependent alcohol dehydrogenase [Brochothrix thermosphacta]EUJ37858.1 alcohol dehydrogenase [Brochothrix thermosphacta DSM 20171 = FSL F6-1036]MBR5527225.1 iron-containing alcohol dehydrogenase [Brochothrix sp.]